MKQVRNKKARAMLRRELQEYRNSFIWTPVVVAGVLILCMLASVILANRITVAGDSIIDILYDENSQTDMHITISLDDDKVVQDYQVTREGSELTPAPEDWNFSREWSFNPERKGPKAEEDPRGGPGSLNPILNGLHCLFLLLLLATSCNYLLGTFHQDRRDRSVLFWKSMPVSEVQEVAVKMFTVSLVAPVIYLVVSMLTQGASVGLAMLITWRMDMNPVETILGHVDFLTLFRGQLGGMLIWAAYTAPFYAWLLLCSSAAKRSPLLLAMAIPLAVVVLEQLFIGSQFFALALSNHIPNLQGGSGSGESMGFYLYEPRWGMLNFVDMILGLLVAMGLLAATAWFRKHRFEI